VQCKKNLLKIHFDLKLLPLALKNGFFLEFCDLGIKIFEIEGGVGWGCGNMLFSKPRLLGVFRARLDRKLLRSR